MLHFLYTGIFLLSVVYLIILIACFREHISIYYVLLFCSILLYNFGTMQIQSAHTLEAAIFANQTIYLGASVSSFFMFMCIADLCKIKIKQLYQAIFLIYGCILFTLISTIGVNGIYYRHVQLVESHGVSLLVKEYGPLHTLYPLYLIVTLSLCFVLIINSFKRKRDVSYRTSGLLLSLMLITCLTYIVEKSLHLPIELMPFSYVLGQAGLLLLLRKISLYDVDGLSRESLAISHSYGFVLCDTNGRYLGSDEDAKLWFPEIASLPLDMPFPEENTPFLQQISRWLREEDNHESVYFGTGDVIVEASYSVLHHHKHHNVICIELRDDTQQQKYNQLMKQYNENLEQAVKEKTQRLRHVQEDIIISMASIVENRDGNTGGHIRRTSDIVKIFVDHLLKEQPSMGITPEFATRMIKAAPLHDFGKIAIPDYILNKPGKFEPDEYEKMKEHSAKGAVIVEQILQNVDDTSFRELSVNVAHYHHEKWNGEGYPEKMAGENIPLEARVMALADVFDALVSKRVYKEKFDYDKAFTIIVIRII